MQIHIVFSQSTAIESLLIKYTYISTRIPRIGRAYQTYQQIIITCDLPKIPNRHILIQVNWVLPSTITYHSPPSPIPKPISKHTCTPSIVNIIPFRFENIVINLISHQNTQQRKKNYHLNLI